MNTINIRTNADKQVFPLKEEPLLVVPEAIRQKLRRNTELLGNFLNGFETFLRMNPQQELKKIQPPESLHTADEKLQKEFNPSKRDLIAQKSKRLNLNCYVNACIYENMTERAFAIIKSIRSSESYKRQHFKLNSEPYITLMAKYSSQGNWNKVKEIYNIFITDQMPITPQVYMNILDCLGRMNDSKGSTATIKVFLDKAEAQVQ